MSKPRPTDAEFVELKRKRDEAVSAAVKGICEQHGWDMSNVAVHASHTGECYCACPDGPCQHDWTGPDVEFDEGRCVSRTCKRCGTPAIYHDMRVAP